MRIFNATNSVLSLPLAGNQKLEIQARSVSPEFMGSKEFLSMVITSFTDRQIAIVVSGPYELNVCANIPTAVNYVVQTLDEALQRFCMDKKPEPKKEEEKPCECHECSCKEEMHEGNTVENETPTEPETPEEPEITDEAPVEEEEVVEEKKSRKKKTSRK